MCVCACVCRGGFLWQAMDNDFNSGYIANVAFTTPPAEAVPIPDGALLIHAALPVASATEVRLPAPLD